MFHDDLITLLAAMTNVLLGGVAWYLVHYYTESKLRAMKQEMGEFSYFMGTRIHSLRRELEERIERLEDEAGIGTGSMVDKDELDSTVSE